jgi:hypothetical protein
MKGLRLSGYALSSCVAAALLAGCGGSQGQLGGTGAIRGLTPVTNAHVKQDSSAKYVYVANAISGGPNYATAIDIYPAALSGNISPSAVISGSLTQLTRVGGIIVDSTGEIYVANIDTEEVVGFAPGSSGNVAPNVVIAGSNTALAWPVGLALDASGNLYIANCGSACQSNLSKPSVLEFSPGSNGNVSPVRNISGPQTQLAHANAAALDSSGSIYVSNYVENTIVVFASNANGNVTPIRVIAGSNTLLDGPDGIAVDRHGLWAGSANEDFLERFKPNINGNVHPAGVISGKRTGIGDLDGITVDSRGNVWASSPGNRRILEFATRAQGDIKPLREIHGSNTQLIEPVWVYVR